MCARVVAVAALLCLGGGLPAEAAWQRHQDDNGVIYYREAPVVVDATADPHPRRKTRRSAGSAPARLKSSAAGGFKPAPNKRYRRVQRERQQAEARQRKRCERYQRELGKVEQALAAGYREPRGNRLRRRKRELESALFEQCH